MFSRYFIDRPIFATVLSIVITLAGAIALWALPLALYPPIAPPTVQVTCQYPGASAQVVAETVAAPIEQQVNGVENMMYMSSVSANDGNYSLTVTFRHGVNMNLAQVLVQNRVALAMPLLPDVIKATGVTTKKQSPDILMAIGIYSPDKRFDQLYLSNYAQIHLQPELARLPGISDVRMFGQRDYSMRIWLDPDKLAVRNMTAGDVVRALREQNLQVAAGQIGQSPTVPGQQTQVTLTTLGRLIEPEQFAKTIIKRTDDGRVVRVRDVGWVELGAKNQDMSSKVDGTPVANMAIFQLPDANALDTADLVKAKIKELRKEFPDGVDYMIRYDTTPFIRESIQEVFKTLFDSVMLVALVVLLFLQNWRSAIIPLFAVPVGIVGTFAVMLAMGFSLNNLTLFGLVLAIGIVVDDAIVVVEAVEHHIEHGLAPRAATIKAMSEVSSPVIAVGLVLSSVFIPCAFITGITGQFFRQFALTIASSTIISTFNSLTLSPALAAMLLKPKGKGGSRVLPWPVYLILGGWVGYSWLGPYLLQQAGGTTLHAGTAFASYVFDLAESAGLPPERAAALAGVLLGALAGWTASRPLDRVLGWFFDRFNRGFQATARGYARLVGGLLRVFVLVLLVYGGLLVLTYEGFIRTPRGFIPSQDMGYLLVNVQLPDSAALERTQAVIDTINEIAHQTPGVDATVGIAGQSILLNAYGSNFGTMFLTLKPFDQRHGSLLDRFFRWLDLWVDLEKLDPNMPERLKAELAECTRWERIEKLEEKLQSDPRGPRWLLAELAPYVQNGRIDKLDPNLPQRLRAELTQYTRTDRLDPKQPDYHRIPPPLAKELSAHTLGHRLRSWLRLPPEEPSLYYETVMGQLYGRLGARIHDAEITIFGPPPVRGVGRAGGYMIMIEDRGDLGPKVLQEQTDNIVAEANKQPALLRNTSVFRANVPQIYLDVDRTACMLKGVQLQDVFESLQVYLGSLYVNDFNLFGRTWQVIAQAEAKYRDQKDDIRRLRVRNQGGTMVPLGAVADVRDINGPLVLTRYNMYPAASINGSAKPGVSTGTAIAVMEELAREELPKAMSFEWTELAYLELQAGNTAMIVFAFSIVMVFLVLAAQFESWSMPLAVILSVPLCILSALAGVNAAKMDINIFTQIGLVVLVGLASKNAILIVEFAKVIHRSGKPIREATLESCRLRLRPIIMTSMAFILGVIPLLFSHGAGAEMRQTLGMAVFSGMIGVTLFGVILTPVFFYIIDTVSESHFFAAPRVRRIGGIVLGILTLSYLWRPSRWPWRRNAQPAAGVESEP